MEPVLFEEEHRCDKRRSLVPINESVIFGYADRIDTRELEDRWIGVVPMLLWAS